jgi:hypothetical protein
LRRGGAGGYLHIRSLGVGEMTMTVAQPGEQSWIDALADRFERARPAGQRPPSGSRRCPAGRSIPRRPRRSRGAACCPASWPCRTVFINRNALFAGAMGVNGGEATHADPGRRVKTRPGFEEYLVVVAEQRDQPTSSAPLDEPVEHAPAVRSPVDGVALRNDDVYRGGRMASIKVERAASPLLLSRHGDACMELKPDVRRLGQVFEDRL